MTRLWANMEWALEDLPGVDRIVEYETITCCRNTMTWSYVPTTSTSSALPPLWIFDLNMLAAGVHQHFEVLPQQLAEVGHHTLRIIIIFVIGHRR